MIKSRYANIETLKIMGHAPKTHIGPEIELLLWNVFKCQKHNWQRDFQTLIDNKDLILLQEAITNSPFDGLFDNSTHQQWIMARSFRNTRTNIENGISTGSSVAPLTEYFAASSHSEPFTKTKKMLLATYYPLQNAKDTDPSSALLVVNSHLINFVSFNKFKAHLDQVFSPLKLHQGPIIMAGDFNTWNNKRLSYFNQLAQLFSLTQVTVKRRPKASHLYKHLDHIYCRGLDTMNTHVHSNIRSSDHFPISVTFRLKTNSAAMQ